MVGKRGKYLRSRRSDLTACIVAITLVAVCPAAFGSVSCKTASSTRCMFSFLNPHMPSPSLCLSLRALRGGTESESNSQVKSGGSSLGEKQLERLFGTQHILDLKLAGNQDKLIRMIKEHRFGGGEFNVVTLDGKEYHIPGTKKDGDTGPSEHFKDMGKHAGKSAKGDAAEGAAKSDKMSAAKSALAAATSYKGLEYTEAELRKLPKAEAEYRRELMARSKQSVNMELGFEQGLKAGMDVYKSVMMKFGGGDEKLDARSAADDWQKDVPVKGVLQFRYKAKERKVTGKPDTAAAAAAAAAAAPEKAAWAAQRSAAMKRARGSLVEEDKKENQSLSQRINEVVSLRFIFSKALEFGFSVASLALSIVAWVWERLRAMAGSSPKPDAMRAARAAALS